MGKLFRRYGAQEDVLVSSLRLWIAVAAIVATSLNAVISGYFLSFRIEPRIGSIEDALIDTYPGEKASLGLFLKQHFTPEIQTLFFPTQGESWFVSERRLWVLEMYWYPLVVSVQERDYDPGLSGSEVAELEGRATSRKTWHGERTKFRRVEFYYVELEGAPVKNYYVYESSEHSVDKIFIVPAGWRE